MATNLAIDDQLIEAALSIGGQKTKKAVVTQALLEYIQKRQQQQLVGLFGSIDYDADYDYKAQRQRAAARPAARA
jgi:Bacterial antitoxin of type II TA system, VapB